MRHRLTAKATGMERGSEMNETLKVRALSRCSRRKIMQSSTLRPVRVSAPAKFVFWIRAAMSNALLRLTKRIESCDTQNEKSPWLACMLLAGPLDSIDLPALVELVYTPGCTALAWLRWLQQDVASLSQTVTQFYCDKLRQSCDKPP